MVCSVDGKDETCVKSFAVRAEQEAAIFVLFSPHPWSAACVWAVGQSRRITCSLQLRLLLLQLLAVVVI